MDAPVDYLSGLGVLPDPMGSMNKQIATQLGFEQSQAQTQQLQAEAAATQQKLSRAQQFQKDLSSVGSSPSAQNISSLMMKYPEFTDQLKSGWDVKDNAAKTADLTTLGETYSAAASGNWDLALKNAQSRVDADKASGNVDAGDQQMLDQITAAAGGDETARKAVLTTLGTHIAAVSGPEHFATVYGALKGGYTLDQGAARYDDNGNLVAHSPFIKDADGNIRLWNDTGTAPASSVSAGDAPQAAGGFENAVHTVLGNEGGFNPKDLNGSPTNFGINAKANADTLKKMGVDIKDLTRDQAIQIYKGYWDQSGAEQLPPNLQTPYFDVYIRSPATAKAALKASEGDPVTFMHLTDSYFQHLAKKDPEAAKYAQAWSNRDAQNLAIATGKASPDVAAPAHTAATASTDQFPIAIPGASAEQYHTLTDAEVRARGLDPNQQYQLNTKTGQVAGLGQKSADGSDVLKRYGISDNMTGPDMLARLPANMANQVKALAEGRLPMPSSFALAKPYWQQMLQLTSQYDPSFDASSYPARKAAITAFTGTGKGAMLVGSINRAANHLNTLWNANQQLAGPDLKFGPLSSAAAAIGQSFEKPQAAAYDGSLQFVAGELGKLAKAGVVTEGETKRIIDNMNRKNAESTRESAIKTAVQIISGAVDPLKDQYNSAFTNGSARPNIPWVTPKAQQIFQRIGGVDLSLTGANAGSNAANDSLPAGARVIGTYQGKRVIEVNGKRMVEQ